MAEGKVQGEVGRWRKVCTAKAMFLFILFIMFTLCLVNILVSSPHIQPTWGLSTFGLGSHPRNCRFYATKSSSECYQTVEQCKSGCLHESQSLPRGIVQETSDLKLRPLWTSSKAQDLQPSRRNLLAIAAGIKQKKFVDHIVQKFPLNNFTVMLFHYDGIVDKWYDLAWTLEAIHIVALNQTKWWFAKRFLHPDIVGAYEYIFIWDEDLGVENFNARRYLAIMQDEGLQISQPALDPELSDVHHRITMRDRKVTVHRRMIKHRGNGWCLDNSTQPPCTGWVEMMAPVFTKAAWSCAWRMIQNDLVHGWGLDFKLGYCVQGDRTEKVGVIDSEYIVHRGIQSLGGPGKSKDPRHSRLDARHEVRRRSYAELEIFSQRWQVAVRDDKCWVDPYKKRIGGKTRELMDGNNC
ncbi:hypothetical protein O6H91_01G031000 [Diphasiastrum complanatum]|uniref:Uncharacterized protein n=1 Tax=Diphasiastrum complanatum TaxID=34168 RepID=A0ACC2EPH9_DIPCM|nr:hypothetical protein O6H91_01G031000 [Diphasiastrum complanatum]